MMHRSTVHGLLFLFCLFCNSLQAQSEEKLSDQHIRVNMRLIGHELLLRAGDSTSRVLPIEKESNRYKIRLETDFVVVPQELAQVIDSIMSLSPIASSYIVELEACTSDEVLYSYEVNPIHTPSYMPCAVRAFPKACYSIYVTLFDLDDLEAELKEELGLDEKEKESRGPWGEIIIGFFILAILVGSYWTYKRKKKQEKLEEGFVWIGNYKFNPVNSELMYEKTKYELTAKESDLLLLLYESANNTLEKELILQKVWGDEGDYIGRTLDVFISKLRKKLELDSKLKIVNIRGVGYKLSVMP